MKIYQIFFTVALIGKVLSVRWLKVDQKKQWFV